MIAKFTFNYNGGFEKKENAVFQQGSIGVDSYQVFAPFLTTTQVYIKTKRNGDLEFSLWKQLDYNSTIGGWLKTATQDELLVDGEMKVVFKFNNLVSQETSLWVRKGTLIVPEMTTYEALRDYVENQEIRIDQIINGATDIAFDKTGTNLNSDFVEEAIKEVNTKSDANKQDIIDMKDGTTIVKKAEQDKNGNDIVNTYETKADATSKKAEIDVRLDEAESDITLLDGRLDTAEGKVSTLETKVQTLEEKTTSIYDYKGSVLFENLPTTGQVTGDTYNILDDFTLGDEQYLAGTDVAWNGSAWNPLGSHIPNGDEVQYSLGVSVNEKIDTKLDSDKVKTAFSGTPLDTNVISEKLAKDTFDVITNTIEKVIDTKTYNDYISININPTLTEGYVPPNTGIPLYDLTTFEYTQKINVQEGDILNAKNSSDNNRDIRFVACYLNDVVVPSAGSNIEQQGFTVPSGVNQVILTVRKTALVTKISIDRVNSETNSYIKNKPLGYMMVKGNLVDGESLTLPIHNVKINNTLIFTATISTLNQIKIGKQSNTYIIIDNTNVTTYSDIAPIVKPHGLTINGNIQVVIENETATNASLIKIVSNGNEYSILDNTRFPMDEGQPYATSIGSQLINCVFSWTSKNINNPIWIFGDSYISWYEERWAYYLAKNGNTNSVMLNGYAGQNSASAYTSLINLLSVKVPKYVVWCLGMNDGDSGISVNTSWFSIYNKLIELSKKYGFELMFQTIPTTPIINNNFKNNIIRSSEYRYIDVDTAIRVNESGDWLDGTLDVDDVHPTSLGAKVIYYVFINELPEIISKGLDSSMIPFNDDGGTLISKTVKKAINELSSKKANITQEEWITPTLINGWQTYVDSPFQFRKDNFGRVWLRGRLNPATKTNNQFYQFPVGYRPVNTVYVNFSGTDYITISNGGVAINYYTFWVGFDSISFSTT